VADKHKKIKTVGGTEMLDKLVGKMGGNFAKTVSLELKAEKEA